MNPIKFDRYKDLHLPGLRRRRVDVWLPPAYAANPEARFPVLYMHDGQNLFKPKPPQFPGWRVAETVTSLDAKGNFQAPIVVGLHNTLNRLGDYLPQKPFRGPQAREYLKTFLTEKHIHLGRMVSDRYLEWMINVVKPFIDQTYRTRTSAADTAVMGSSMGGLISLYALCEYPQAFGNAGCLSTHWPIVGDAMLQYCADNLHAAGSQRLYFDHGTEGVDSGYAPWQQKMDALVQSKGYLQDIHMKSLVFEGESHHERYWAQRLHIPLAFFFGETEKLPA